MPSVGGGGSGGGFHGGGGFSGGSFGGGGYHGGGYYGGFFGFRRRSILGSLVSAILSPIIFGVIGIICIVVFFTIVGKPGTKTINYDEDTFQEYAFDKYYELYGNSEDDVLFVFLASKNPEEDGYYQISICGDNLRSSVTYLFGNDSTVFGGAMENGLPKNYKNSMLPAIRTATETTANAIKNLGTPDKRYYSLPTGRRSVPQFIDKTGYLNVNVEYAQEALQEFYDETDVVLSIYVDDMDNVFKRTNWAWIVLVVGIIFTAIGVLLIFAAIKAYKAYKARKNGGSSNRSNGSNGSDGSNGLDNDIFRSSRHTDEGGYY